MRRHAGYTLEMQFPQSVLSILERGGKLVTANARSARDFRELYGEHQLARPGQNAWASPSIDDWHSWLAEHWQQLLLTGTEPRLLLSPLQEESVWADIARQEVESRSLISPQEVARLAQGAYKRLAAYGGTAQLRQGPWGATDHSESAAGIDTQETELFRRWALEFERRCERRGWLTSSMLPWIVASAIADHKISVPTEIAWSGFDRTTPAEAAVRHAMTAVGCLQSDAAWEIEAVARRVSVPDAGVEMEACALWARDFLENHPSAHIGILLQDAASNRATIDRVFRRILMPASAGLRAVPETALYEFTLGLPLSSVPLVRAALLFLQWLDQPLEREQISWLLTTGFLGVSEDTWALAAADTQLQQEELLPPEMSLDQLLQRLETDTHRYIKTSGAVGRWTTAVRHARAVLIPLLSRERSCRQWIDTIHAILTAARWPGTRPEDSVSYQVRDRWREVLGDIASLDFAEMRLSYARFLDHLRTHAQAALFTAESVHAPISISGVPESAGRVYDAIWILQTTDDRWPIRSSAHSMLPHWLQEDLGIPRGDAQQDAVFSATVLKRLQQSTRQLTASYAREGKNGTQRPAYVFADFPQEELAPAKPLKVNYLAEAFEDNLAVPWPGGAFEAGGQETLKMQAACPFKAFAAKRLGARELRLSAHGFDAAQRGTLLHDVMHSLWDDPRMKSSAGLHALVANGRYSTCVAEHVDRSLARYANDTGAWDMAYLQLESQRLCALIESWLMLELNRPAFEVEHTEEKRTVTIDGLRLNVRLDRVDKLVAQGEEFGRILLDYKTGEVHASKWMGPRMEEPQLPLYAIAGSVEGLQDVFFAQLRAGKLSFTGTSKASQALVSTEATSGAADAASRNFNETLANWAGWLSETSQQFQQGAASVDPKNNEQTCKYCGFGGICRVAQTTKAPSQLNEEEGL